MATCSYVRNITLLFEGEEIDATSFELMNEMELMGETIALSQFSDIVRRTFDPLDPGAVGEYITNLI